ncbi:hypothetical protein VTK26DRAFT_1336 [Humicola hyalothermophila]
MPRTHVGVSNAAGPRLPLSILVDGIFLLPSLSPRQVAAFPQLSITGIAPDSPSNTTTDGAANPTPIPLVVSNSCDETIWPGIATQHGIGPGISGFELPPRGTIELHVSADWQGRVWGRTNCSFSMDGSAPSSPQGVNGKGAACLTGDCQGKLNCEFGGEIPATLAEFNLMGGISNKQTFYDISLVDGYNLPMALIYIPAANTSWLPANLTNPVCVATPGYYVLPFPLSPPPMANNLSSPILSTTIISNSTATNNTNTSIPHYYSTPHIPFPPPSPHAPYDPQTTALLRSWCPWNLQLYPPRAPASGVFPYPDSDTTIQRPVFDPCLSDCSRTGSARDCCTGAFADPRVCRPGLYSQMAKRVCPDAFSYAFDDGGSQFAVPAGGGWEVRFCPRGVGSTRILEGQRRRGGWERERERLR